ncbi:UpxY family transcription antiterminator [Chitinophaga eiseniae]|uniref:UpxY family transcription antiterminator n=1 Tax=Chitinophaga eiseniae TaxID=634771 RepID=A0A847SDD0_9BACT|nr:UpxY family transcription antiterminator [Chitinophaga eiseniae]NLR77753.1 UpxY family transcription antiterminator [Chitinophaga eiseniae]
MCVSSPEEKWLVVYTKPKLEKKIAAEITSMAYECYLPLYTVARKWSDRIKRLRQPLFPNYLFVKINPREKFRVLSANGVIRLVAFKGELVAVSDEEIARIRMIEMAGCEITREHNYCIGEKVKVIEGVLSGLEGILVKRHTDKRFVVQLPLINQSIGVEIPMHCLERVS